MLSKQVAQYIARNHIVNNLFGMPESIQEYEEKVIFVYEKKVVLFLPKEAVFHVLELDYSFKIKDNLPEKHADIIRADIEDLTEVEHA